MTRAVQIAACLVLMLGAVEAEEANVYSLLSAGKAQEAYALAVQNQRSHVGDLVAEEELAAAEASYFRFADGEERLDRLISAHPDQPEPLRLQAYIHFATARRDEAWEYLERALAIAPDDAGLLAMRDAQRAMDGMYTPPPSASLPRPERAVAALFEDVRAGAPNRTIASHVVRGFGELSEKELNNFLAGYRDVGNQPGGNRMHLVGYAFETSEKDAAGDTVVAGTIIVRMSFGKNAVEQVARGALITTAIPVFGGGGLGELPAKERAAVVARLVGYEIDNVVPVEVTVTGNDPARIREVRLGGIVVSKLIAAGHRVATDGDEKTLVQKAKSVALFIFVVGGIGILVTVMRRHDRAQRRSRR